MLDPVSPSPLSKSLPIIADDEGNSTTGAPPGLTTIETGERILMLTVLVALLCLNPRDVVVDDESVNFSFLMYHLFVDIMHIPDITLIAFTRT